MSGWRRGEEKDDVMKITTLAKERETDTGRRELTVNSIKISDPD